MEVFVNIQEGYNNYFEIFPWGFQCNAHNKIISIQN